MHSKKPELVNIVGMLKAFRYLLYEYFLKVE